LLPKLPTWRKSEPSTGCKSACLAQVFVAVRLTFFSDVRAKVPIISTFAKDVQKQNAAGANLVLPLVVYDLPERDCAALASNGELSLANNGTALYQEYIDMIAAQIKSFPDVTFLLVIGTFARPI
jgi:cellulase/cellobiase CelA1